MYKQNEIARPCATRPTTGSAGAHAPDRSRGVHPSVKSDPLLAVPYAIAGEAFKACVFRHSARAPRSNVRVLIAGDRHRRRRGCAGSDYSSVRGRSKEQSRE
jgi:hypothetical protein